MYRFIITAFLFSAAMGHAATVYKTVDENGVVGFSDTPPIDSGSAEVLQFTPALSNSPEEYSAWLEQMRDATNRMAADRREREKHRVKLREARSRTAAYQEPQSQTAASDQGVHYPYNRPVTRPSWRRNHHSNTHPIIYSPLKSARISSGSSNAQLMRPLVSTRR
jgi:hypothetical protein